MLAACQCRTDGLMPFPHVFSDLLMVLISTVDKDKESDFHLSCKSIYWIFTFFSSFARGGCKVLTLFWDIFAGLSVYNVFGVF